MINKLPSFIYRVSRCNCNHIKSWPKNFTQMLRDIAINLFPKIHIRKGGVDPQKNLQYRSVNKDCYFSIYRRVLQTATPLILFWLSQSSSRLREKECGLTANMERINVVMLKEGGRESVNLGSDIDHKAYDSLPRIIKNCPPHRKWNKDIFW